MMRRQPQQPRLRRQRELDELMRRMARRQAKAQQFDAAAMNALAHNLGQLAARRPLIRIGVAPVPAIALGATTVIPIVWSTPMPSDTYDVDIAAATALIGRATWTLTGRTKAGVDVTMTAGLAVSLGQWIVAVGTH